jgi:uncharacterized protein (TIGR03435 family)
MKSLPLLLTISAAAIAQTPAFDAASIKPNQSIDGPNSVGGPSSIRPSKGRVSMENVSLNKVLLNAYGIPDDREYMVDGPNWLATEHFNIDATFPGDTPPPQVRQMLQTLLAERFKLVLHKETRQLPQYSLVVAKNGPKIHAVEIGQGRTSSGPGRLEASKITMPKLADLLGRLVSAPVVDATGLKGPFDFTLTWPLDEAPPAGDGAGASVVATPGLFAALEEQLGLKLMGGKGPLEVLVVDHVEKTPTGN